MAKQYLLIIGTLKTLVLNMSHIFAIVVMVFIEKKNGLMQKAINFNDLAIVSIKESDYRIHFWYMSKSDAINI